jgi:hypothetical protein
MPCSHHSGTIGGPRIIMPCSHHLGTIGGPRVIMPCSHHSRTIRRPTIANLVVHLEGRGRILFIPLDGRVEGIKTENVFMKVEFFIYQQKVKNNQAK